MRSRIFEHELGVTWRGNAFESRLHGRLLQKCDRECKGKNHVALKGYYTQYYGNRIDLRIQTLTPAGAHCSGRRRR